MWFHFYVGNHGTDGRATVLDVIPWMTGSLAKLKHEVTIGDRIAPNATNILIDNFVDADEQVVTDYPFKFGLVATEIPVGQSFNGLNEEPWLTRRRAFDKIASRAQFIWSFVEEPVDAYARWAPSGYLELGYLDSIVDPVFSQEPEFDFGFYGLHLTSYRAKVLERLRKHFTVAMPRDFLIGSEVNKFIATFKIGICLKHTPDWPIPSPARISRLLHAKRGVAAEYVPVRTRASALAPMAEKDQDFVEFCLECLNGPWKVRANDAFERFRATMPMTEIMEKVLDETVAKASLSSPQKRLAISDDKLRMQVPFSSALPQLIHSEQGYNFVAFESFVYAVAQAIGPVDFFRDTRELIERWGSRAVVVARTFDDARRRVNELSKSPPASAIPAQS